jgi:hypothetical protein
VAADIVVGVNDEDLLARLGGANGRGDAGSAGTDDNDVGFKVPLGRNRGLAWALPARPAARPPRAAEEARKERLVRLADIFDFSYNALRLRPRHSI